MDSRLVLVIEGDEPTANQLAAAIRQADYEVVVSNGARTGLDTAIEIKPDCIVCDVELPDEDGYWVARHIRTHASAVAVTPFLFLSSYDDAESRLEGFHVGADVYMSKPFEMEEVVAQVDALVKLASRLRQRRDSLLSTAPEQEYGSTAIEGDLRQMSIATVLSVLGMERRTGVFEVVSKKRRAQIEISGGYVVHGTIGGTRVTALGAMRVMLTWKVGRFSFTPLPPCDPPPSLRTVQVLLLDAAKAEDEAAASAPSYGSVSLSSFGGPPSRPDDTGPPSSRAMRDAHAPVSIAFDLIPSRRPEEMPAAEVAAAVDPAMAAFERGHTPTLAPAPPSVDLSISVDIDDEEVMSVRIDEVDADGAGGGERMFLEEHRTTTMAVSWAARAAPTPPSGTPLPPPRRAPAIVPPPPGARLQVGRLPAPSAPPAPPRPAAAPKATPEKTRVPQRANQKKN